MAGLDPDLSSYNGAETNKMLATPTNTADNINGWLSAARQGVALNAQQFDLAQKHLSALNGLVGSVMADPTEANATARIQDGVRMGVIPQEEAAKEFSDLHSLGGDPAKIKQWAFQHGQVLGTLQEQMQAGGMAPPELVNTGNALAPYVTRSGLNPGVAPAAGNPLPLQQSPSELATPTTWTDSNGVTHQGTRKQYQGVVGDPSGISSPNSYVDPKRAATAGVSIVDGKPVYGAAPGAAPASLAAMPGIAGPAPGIAGAADSTAQAGAAMGNALTAAADKATDRRATLSNLQGQLANIATGPNADTWNTVKAGANAALDIAGAPESVRFDRQKIASAEEFRKNAQILANQQQQALGGTDAALAAGAHSNPNLDLSTLGNRQILATLQGNEDAIQAKSTAWQKWLGQGNSPATYPQFAAEFNKTFSPRAFQFAHMTPDERATMVKTMNPQDRQALAGALSTARTNGWINPGGQ